ncbi:MAG: hypothetical protein ACE5FG_13405 [Myxococcota bacterium]
MPETRAWSRAVLTTLVLVGLWSTAAQRANAQLSRDQGKCLTALIKDHAKLASTQGKDICACLKDHAKRKLSEPVESCVVADRKDKLAKTRAKLEKDFAKSCAGLDADGAPRLPSFGPLSLALLEMVAGDQSLALVHQVFGSDLDVSLVPEATDKTISKCQQALAKDLKKCHDARLKAYVACVKDGVKNGIIRGTADLANCLDADPKGKITKACGPGGKLLRDISKKCPGVDLQTTVPGCAASDASSLHACLAAQAACASCLAFNTAAELSRDCDLFDDGQSNTSCPTTFLGYSGRRIGTHERVFDEEKFCVGGDLDGQPCTDAGPVADHRGQCPPGPPSARCLQRSFAANNYVGSLPLFTLPLNGGSILDCGPVDPQTGVAECSSELTGVEAVELPVIGFVCFEPTSGCPKGFIDCDGGTPANPDLVATHTAGEGVFCGFGDDPNDLVHPGTGNAECESQCRSFCTALPGQHELFVSGCEGYCEDGPNKDRRCTLDLECPGSNCTGEDPVEHRRTCQCQCLEIGGTPARSGGLLTFVGVRIVVEQDAPCDGLDVTSIVGTRCGTSTTETASARIVNANLRLESVEPPPLTGSPADCNRLALGEGRTAVLVGHRIFLSTALGDQLSETTAHTLPPP